MKPSFPVELGADMRIAADLPPEEVDKARRRTSAVTVRKGCHFPCAGEIPFRIGFHVSRLLRLYYVDAKGVEIVKHFCVENTCAISFSSPVMRTVRFSSFIVQLLARVWVPHRRVDVTVPEPQAGRDLEGAVSSGTWTKVSVAARPHGVGVSARRTAFHASERRSQVKKLTVGRAVALLRTATFRVTERAVGCDAALAPVSSARHVGKVSGLRPSPRLCRLRCATMSVPGRLFAV